MALMLQDLTTEGRNPASDRLDSLSPLEIARLINAEDARVAEAVGRETEAIAHGIAAIAQQRLAECDGKVKTAIVAQLRNVSPVQARALLTAVGGHLRRVLEEGSQRG